MDESLIFYWDRSNHLNIVDSGAISHFKNGHPVLNIVVDIINAGYHGVMIDEQRLSNGKYFHALSVDLNSPEGAIISAIQKSCRRLLDARRDRSGEGHEGLGEVVRQ